MTRPTGRAAELGAQGAVVDDLRIAPVHRFVTRGAPGPEDDRFGAVGRPTALPVDLRPAERSAPPRPARKHRAFGSISITSTTVDQPERDGAARPEPDALGGLVRVSVPEPGVRVEHGGRQVRAGPGSLIAHWSVEPSTFTADRPTEMLTLAMPIVELGLPHLFVRDLTGRDLGRSPLGPLLHAHLMGLAGLPELPADAAGALERPTVDLVRAVLSIAGGDEAADGALSHALAPRIVIHLRGRLSDPGLSADSVAAHFGISRRYLYVVLAQIGVTFGDWVRTERLRRAAEVLRDPGRVGMSVAAIARTAGFLDHSSFSRAFREHFACTPTEYRVAAGAATD